MLCPPGNDLRRISTMCRCGVPFLRTKPRPRKKNARPQTKHKRRRAKQDHHEHRTPWPTEDTGAGGRGAYCQYSNYTISASHPPSEPPDRQKEQAHLTGEAAARVQTTPFPRAIPPSEHPDEQRKQVHLTGFAGLIGFSGLLSLPDLSGLSGFPGRRGFPIRPRVPGD